MTKEVDQAIGSMSQEELVKLSAEILCRVDATRENAQLFLDHLAITASFDMDKPFTMCSEIMTISVNADREAREDMNDDDELGTVD